MIVSEGVPPCFFVLLMAYLENTVSFEGDEIANKINTLLVS